MNRVLILVAVVLSSACAYGPTGGYDPETEEPIQRANSTALDPAAARDRQVWAAPAATVHQRTDVAARPSDRPSLVDSAE
jgi:hypothetical protein